MKKAFGIDRLDLATITGYFGMEIHLFIILSGPCTPLLSSGLLSKEEGEKTAEFLLSRPITRASVVTKAPGICGIRDAVCDRYLVGNLCGHAALHVAAEFDSGLTGYWAR